MRANYNLVITAPNLLCVLVPYRPEHVPLYHTWMQDEHLQAATASEPLTLEQEYQMQQSWMEDEKKCTFIILDPAYPDSEGTGTHGGGMAGDCNLFWNDHDEEHTAEIEIMIAEDRSRRKGIASEALKVFMAYAAGQLGVLKFRAKIGDDNAASLALFKSLGYIEVGHTAIFEETTLELSSADSSDKWRELLQLSTELKTGSYDY